MKKRIFWFFVLSLFFTGICAAAQPDGQLTFTITPAVKQGTKQVELWLPYPVSDEFQTISDMTITGNFDSRAVYRDPFSEALYLRAAWNNPSGQPQCIMQFHITQKDRRNPEIKPSDERYPEIIAPYLEATPFVPADDPELKKIAMDAIQGKKNTFEKAKAIYDWVVENTFRDPNVQACGLGFPTRTLQQHNGGGNVQTFPLFLSLWQGRQVSLPGTFTASVWPLPKMEM